MSTELPALRPAAANGGGQARVNHLETKDGHSPGMVVKTRLRAFLRFAILHLGGAAVIAYFGFHAYNGNYGITAQIQYDERKQTLQAELDRLKLEREALEVKVALLSPDALDPDLLEEKARQMLGYVHANDVVVFRRR